MAKIGGASLMIRSGHWLAALADSYDACGFARRRLLFHLNVHQQDLRECGAHRVILDCSRHGTNRVSALLPDGSPSSA